MRAGRVLLGCLSVAVTVLALAVGLLLVGGAGGSSSAYGARRALLGAAGRPGFVDPRSFAYVDQVGVGARVELRSPRTGRVVKLLATFGREFTNNGLALSNDDREVYVTLIGRRNLRIEQLATSAGKRTFVADGWEPAVSPNGRLLSYIEGRATVVVRNLSSGVTHRINVAGLLGRSEALDELAAAAWLGDGSEVVVMVTPIAVAVADRAGGAQADNKSSASVIVVQVGARGRPVEANRVELPGVGDLFRISGDQTTPRGLLAARLGRRTVVDRVDLIGGRAKVTRLLSLSEVVPMAFDPAGHNFLYVAGDLHPALWIARITRGRLAGAHRLVRNADVGAVSW